MADVIEGVIEISEMAKASVEGLRERVVTGELCSLVERGISIFLRGLRGVGKTTALLQCARRVDGLYLPLNHPIFRTASLWKVVKELMPKHVFVDEVHTYPGWERELAAIHDTQGVVIVASGSSASSFHPDRRFRLLHLPPLSLSELVWLERGERVVSREEWKDWKATAALLGRHPEVRALYSIYMQEGAFPAFLSGRGWQEVYAAVWKAIHEDAVNVLRLSRERVFAMERLLVTLALSPVGEFSISSLSSKLGLSKPILYQLIGALVDMGILVKVEPYRRGPGGEPKLLFSHPNLRWALARAAGMEGDKGALREEAAVFGLAMRGYSLFTPKGGRRKADYVAVKGKEVLLIEVGGEGKGSGQMAKWKGEKVVLRESQLVALLLTPLGRLLEERGGV